MTDLISRARRKLTSKRGSEFNVHEHSEIHYPSKCLQRYQEAIDLYGSHRCWQF